MTSSAVSVRMPAEAARLKHSYDAERLVAELKKLQAHTWSLQRGFSDEVLPATEVDWRCLALRSPGGDGSRTDPGGPGTLEFADTEWLDQVPYVREVLASVPAPLRAVRFMSLGIGARGIDHNDTKYGPAWGVARLHVPVTTNPDAVLVLDGVEHKWQPGSFWFGDFSREHRVQNTGESVRVHMVIDTLFVPELAAIFPDSWKEYFADGEALYNRTAAPVPAAELSKLTCRFDLPESFADWEEEDGQFLEPQDTLSAVVEQVDDALELAVSNGSRFRLVHVGEHEFRFAGWSEERTVQLLGSEVVLRTKVGRSVRELSVRATA